MKLEVKTYHELEKCIKAFKKGTFNVLFIIGNPGQSKTTSVTKILGEDKKRGPVYRGGGSLTAFQLYIDLFQQKGRVFVLDDCDSLYSDRVTVRLLKALCETEKIKTIGWHSHNTHLDAQDIPREFETDSRIVIILNHLSGIGAHVESLEDRGLMVFFNPSVDEVLNNGRKWFKDKDIIKFVENHKPYIQTLSLRAMVVAEQLKLGGLDSWKDALLHSLGVKELVLVDSIIKDPRHISEEERIRVFEEHTKMGDKKGLSRTKYFALKRELEKIHKALKHAGAKVL